MFEKSNKCHYRISFIQILLLYISIHCTGTCIHPTQNIFLFSEQPPLTSMHRTETITAVTSKSKSAYSLREEEISWQILKSTHFFPGANGHCFFCFSCSPFSKSAKFLGGWFIRWGGNIHYTGNDLSIGKICLKPPCFLVQIKMPAHQREGRQQDIAVSIWYSLKSKKLIKVKWHWWSRNRKCCH